LGNTPPKVDELFYFVQLMLVQRQKILIVPKDLRILDGGGGRMGEEQR
jgi:hypothetical protein